MGTLEDILNVLERNYRWEREWLRRLRGDIEDLPTPKLRALLDLLLLHGESGKVDVYGAFYALRSPTLYGFLMELLCDTIRWSKGLLELLLVVDEPYLEQVEETKRVLLELPSGWGGCCNFVVGTVEWTEGDFLESSFDESGSYRWIPHLGAFVSRRTPECSVGTVRKMRSRVVGEDRTCGTCPYFIPKEMLLLAVEVYETKNPDALERLRGMIKERRIELFVGDV